jgi:hypothetical protein
MVQDGKEWFGDLSGLVNVSVAAATPAPTAPAAPSSLSASAASSSQLNLSWSDNSGNEDGFKIERSAAGGATWGQIATPGANATSYQDGGLSAGTSYTYRVRAYNNAGDSAYSNTASAATQAAPAPASTPAAPTGLTASASGGGKRNSAIKLAWLDNSGNESGFKIERAIGANVTSGFTQIATVGASVTGYSDDTGTSGTAYTYRVRAYNGAGDSAYSNTASAVKK